MITDREKKRLIQACPFKLVQEQKKMRRYDASFPILKRESLSRLIFLV